MNNKILHIIMGAIGTGKSRLAEILSTKYKIEVLISLLQYTIERLIRKFISKRYKFNFTPNAIMK